MALTWLKKGEASAEMAKKEEADAAKRKEEMGKMWRFFLGDKEEARITFVDGFLDDKGVLVPPRLYEHMVYFNGQWTTFVCPEKTNPESGDKCPICEGGDRPSLVAMFTIIDHRVVKGKNNKEYSNTPRLFAAKTITFEMLQKIAAKRGGLAGCTFDVARVGEKAAAVGSMFDFVEKQDIEVLKQKYTKVLKDEKTGTEKSVSIFVPADYETEIVYRSADQLRALGLGKAPNVGLYHKPNEGGNAPESDYGSQM